MRAFPTRKFVGTVGVVALHVGVIAALLNALYKPAPPIASSQEHIVWFWFAPKPLPAIKVETPSKARERVISTPFRYPDYSKINLPPMPGETNLGALHGFLFDCAPQNLINLTPEQRARCATASHPPDDSVDYADHTDRSKNAVRWARGLMRKQQPTLLPCMPPFNPIYTIACLSKGASQGFDLDAMPSYGDKPQDVHVPNNGDPPDSPPG